ncbi:MAG: ABC transporter substrate-binding protein [Burkholderiales bacterium]|nr:ABC transporter substrate-binding protein [Burkholderiales bacterium]
MNIRAKNGVWRQSAAALVLCCSVLLAITAQAGPKASVPRIGFLAFDEGSCRNEPFVTGLRELGYLEGKTIVIECRHAGGRDDGIQQAADALVRSKPAIIVAFGQQLIIPAQRATKTIPIVMLASGEPVESGFATSLARPGGNLTGLTYYATELNAKRLEFLKAVVPRLRRAALLVSPQAPAGLIRAHLRDTRSAAKVLGLEIVVVEAKGEADLERAFDEIVKARAQAVLILPYSAFAKNAQEIADIAKWRELPTIHFLTRYSALGGLMAYGPDYGILHRRAAAYVDKILKGASPAELPIEQPMRFEFSINLQTARELGLKVPQTLLLRADKVIQ